MTPLCELAPTRSTPRLKGRYHGGSGERKPLASRLESTAKLCGQRQFPPSARRSDNHGLSAPSEGHAPIDAENPAMVSKSSVFCDFSGVNVCIFGKPVKETRVF